MMKLAAVVMAALAVGCDPAMPEPEPEPEPGPDYITDRYGIAVYSDGQALDPDEIDRLAQWEAQSWCLWIRLDLESRLHGAAVLVTADAGVIDRDLLANDLAWYAPLTVSSNEEKAAIVADFLDEWRVPAKGEEYLLPETERCADGKF